MMYGTRLAPVSEVSMLDRDVKSDQNLFVLFLLFLLSKHAGCLLPREITLHAVFFEDSAQQDHVPGSGQQLSYSCVPTRRVELPYNNDIAVLTPRCNGRCHAIATGGMGRVFLLVSAWPA